MSLAMLSSVWEIFLIGTSRIRKKNITKIKDKHGGFMKQIKIGAITIGQTPRTDISKDILPILPQNITLVEYGALDEMMYDDVMSHFHPQPGDEVLVSRMRDGKQVQLTDRFIIPLVQKKIDLAETEGVLAIILFCTGVFPEFRHHVLLLKPQPLFHAIAAKLADGQKIGVLVPNQDQIMQAYHTWNMSGIQIIAVSVSPYLESDKVIEAATYLKAKGVSFICADCMGYSLNMKHHIQEITGIPVLLPRTLIVSILCEMFD